MQRPWLILAFLVIALSGCGTDSTTIPQQSSPPSRTENTPYVAPRPVKALAKISWDTDRDRVFAEFLRDKSGGMIKEAAVGVERKGSLRIELDRSVTPDETLPLSKSVIEGVRKDFPDQPVTVSIYDPKGEPILKARFQPGQGVKYQIAHESAPLSTDRPEVTNTSKTSSTPLDRPGMTQADQKFATWAEEHGKGYLRYVEADLEKHGRLWFGVSREVKPADVPKITQSLLEGARREFPRGILVANVFDPEGERIGRAYLENDGKIRWDQ